MVGQTTRSKDITPQSNPDNTVLVINSGSSSLKYQLVQPYSGEVVVQGLVERIGESQARVKHVRGGEESEFVGEIADHRAGLAKAIELFSETGHDLGSEGIVAVGHRVVQIGRAQV